MHTADDNLSEEHTLLSGWLDSLLSVLVSLTYSELFSYLPSLYLSFTCIEDTAVTHIRENLSNTKPSAAQIFDQSRVVPHRVHLQTRCIVKRRCWTSRFVFSAMQFLGCTMRHVISPQSSTTVCHEKHQTWIGQVAKSVTHLYTHTERDILSHSSSSSCGTVYKLVCPLLMTVGCWGWRGVFWRGTMKAVWTCVFSSC